MRGESSHSPGIPALTGDVVQNRDDNNTDTTESRNRRCVNHISWQPVRGRSRKWSEEEERLLWSLYSKTIQGKTDWKEIERAFASAGYVRTPASIKAKAYLLRDSRSRTMEAGIPETLNTAERLPDLGESGGDERVLRTGKGEDVCTPEPEFIELYNKILRKACVQPMHLRKAIPNRMKIKETTLAWANAGLALRRGEKWSLLQLNHAVYAAARACIEWTAAQQGETAQMSQKGRIAEAQENITEVRRQISYVNNEIQRRIERRKITPKEMERLRKIRKDLRARGTTAQLKRKLCDLKLKLKIDVNHLKRRQAEYERKSIRIKYETTGGNLHESLPRQKKANTKLSEEEKRKLLEFWKSVFGEERGFRCIPEIKTFVRDVADEIVAEDLTEQDLRRHVPHAIAKLRPWKSPGPDKIQAFWWKTFPAARLGLEEIIVELLNGNKDEVPKWFLKGRTVLIPKTDEPAIGDYRPIACLNIQYKVVTSVVARILYERYEKSALLFPREQLALRRGQRGCLNAHLMDQAVQLDVTYRRQTRSSGLATAWIDFKKAFDSVSHEYLVYMMEKVGFPKGIRNFLKTVMAGWRTALTLNGEEVGTMSIKSGVFQGDSLSPLLFCLAIAPISSSLKRQVAPYVSSGEGFKISHIYYVDDLKIYTHTEEAMSRAIEIVQRISDSIGLELNAKKSAVQLYKLSEDKEAIAEIPTLQGDYAYLGVKQTVRTSVRAVLAECRGKIEAKTRAILHAPGLSAGQRIRSLNTVVMPIAQYIFTHSQVGQRYECAIRFAKDLDCSMRRELSNVKLRYLHAPYERLYVAREEGGLGLVSFEEILTSSTVDAAVYLSTNRQVSEYREGFWKFAERRGKRTLIADARRALTGLPLQVHFTNGAVIVDGATCGQECIPQLRKAIRQAFRTRAREGWDGAVASKFGHIESASREASDRWIAKGAMSCENLRLALGVREGNILSASGIQPRLCHACKKAPESVQHVSSNCESYRTTLMIERHDAVARVIYDYLKKIHGLDSKHYSEYPEPEVGNARARILWNVKLRTNHEIYHRQPDIVLFEKEKGVTRRVVVLEIAVSDPQSLCKQIEIKRNRYCVNGELQDEETITPYKPSVNLVRDIENQYAVKVEFVPVVVSTTGHIPNSLIADLEEKIGVKKRDMVWIEERIGRAAALGTARLWKVHLARVPT